MADDKDLGTHMRAVVNALTTELERLTRSKVNKGLSSKTELRFGTNGSFSIDLEKGVWKDHERQDGGGVLDLIKMTRGLDKPDAIAWMRDELRLPVGGGSRSVTSGGRDEEPPPFDTDDRADAPRARQEIVKVYKYTDGNGDLSFEVCRMGPKKTFLQRRPPLPDDPHEKIKNGWVWSSKGAEMVPYRLPELIEAIKDGSTVFYLEGEKDVDNAIDEMGVPATCNPMGAGKWWPELAQYFTGADVVIINDNDEAGREHADAVAQQLLAVAKRVRRLSLPDLPEKGDLTDWKGKGGNADALYDLVDKSARKVEKAPFKSKLGGVLWQDIPKTELKYEWLVKGVLARREVGVMAGPSQSGKSFLATDLAGAIATGADWMGKKTLQGGVFYVAAESGIGVITLRWPAYAKHFGIKFDERVPLVTIPRRINFFVNDDDCNALIADIKAFQAEFGVPVVLTIIDTFSAVTPGMKENDSSSVGPVLKRARRIPQETESGALIVHHLNAEGDKIRGHSSLVGDVEDIILVGQTEERDADKRIIREATAKKVKEGLSGTKWRFVLKQVKLGTDADNEEITSCIVEKPSQHEYEKLQDEVKSTGEVTITAKNTRLALHALCEAMIKHGVMAAPSLKAPPGSKMVSKEQWREEFARIAPEGEDDKEGAPEEVEKKQKQRDQRVRRAVDRAATLFVDRKIIRVDNPFVCFTGRPVNGFDLSYAGTGLRQKARDAGQTGGSAGQNTAAGETDVRQSDLIPLDDTSPF